MRMKEWIVALAVLGLVAMVSSVLAQSPQKPSCGEVTRNIQKYIGRVVTLTGDFHGLQMRRGDDGKPQNVNFFVCADPRGKPLTSAEEYGAFAFDYNVAMRGDALKQKQGDVPTVRRVTGTVQGPIDAEIAFAGRPVAKQVPFLVKVTMDLP